MNGAPEFHNTAIRKALGTIYRGSVEANGAWIQAFKNYAANHPEFWGEPAISGVVIALRTTWPCDNALGNARGSGNAKSPTMDNDFQNIYQPPVRGKIPATPR
jgi:hypothetical protein